MKKRYALLIGVVIAVGIAIGTVIGVGISDVVTSKSEEEVKQEYIEYVLSKDLELIDMLYDERTGTAQVWTDRGAYSLTIDRNKDIKMDKKTD